MLKPPFLKGWHKAVGPSGENWFYLRSWGWNLQDGISALRRGGDQAISHGLKRIQQNGHLQTGKMAFVGTWPSWHPALGLPASELWEINSCCLSYPICEFVLQQPEQTEIFLLILYNIFFLDSGAEACSQHRPSPHTWFLVVIFQNAGDSIPVSFFENCYLIIHFYLGVFSSLTCQSAEASSARCSCCPLSHLSQFYKGCCDWDLWRSAISGSFSCRWRIAFLCPLMLG